MENKSNSLNRIKRQQREKVLRFSIRKYSFGAASVAVAALMFLGARVASADSVVPNAPQSNTANASVVNPKDKAESPVGVMESTENKVDAENQALTNAAPSASTVDKAKLKKVVEELNALLSTKLNLDESVVSPVKDRLQKGKEALESSELSQKDIDELVELLSKDVTVVSAAAKEATEVQVDKQVDKTEKPADNLANQSSPEVSASEESQTVSAKKDALKVSVDQLQAAVLEVPEHETSKEVLEKANELLGLAQGVLENTTVSLNDVEEMNKRVKRMFNSVKNATTRLTSGARDSRNGQSIPRGTQFRANGQINQGALANIKYYASVDPKDIGGQGNTRNNDPEFTKNKTDIKAYYMQDSQGKWIVYDVFFNNDGRKVTDSSYQQHYYFQAPFNIMDPSNTVKDLTFTRYRNTGGRRLSDGFQGFEQYGNTATITNPWSQQYRIFNGDRDTFYDPNSGITRDNQRWSVFKNNQYDPDLNKLPKDKNGNYPRASYYLGLDVRRESTDYAVHMHAKIKLKNDITEAEANAYGRAYAATVAKAHYAQRSYIMGAMGTSLAPRDTTPPTITANGATVTKNEKIVDIPVTADDNKGGVGMRPNNPIEVTGLPQGLTFTNGKITGTPTGPVGNSTVTIKAYDKNGNKAEKTITITVKDQASKYNPTGDTLTVNQGQTITDDAVKAKVKNYAPGSLTVVSKPSTAKPGNVGNAVVKVTYPDGSSENVNVPVTVLEAPDNQPPTLAISPANQTVVEGEKVTFTVTAKDNKVVTIDGKDFTTKYGNRLLSGKATNTNVKITDSEKVTTITITTTAEDVGKTNTITFNASDNAGNKAKPVTFTFNVTPRDTIPPTITAESVTVTKNEPITPIPVTAVDNTGGVGMRDKNPIEVSNLPQGLKYENGQITGTTNAKTGFYTVKIKAYDKNNNFSEKSIRITVQEQASKYNPTGETLTVNQGQPITDDAVKAKVTNYSPGTLTVQSKPTSTATAGNAGNAVVKVTYPDGSSDTVNVPVTVKDVTGPTITAESTTVTKNTPITPIPVTAVDNTGGVGLRDNNPIQVSNLPKGLKYENGQITGTTNAKTGFYTVKITAYDKNNTPSTKSIRITVQDQLAGTATGKTVPEKTPVPANTKVVTPNRPGTTITTDKPVNGLTVDNGGNLVGTPTVDNWEPKEEERTVEIPVKLKNGPEEVVVKVPVKIQRDTDGDGIPDVTDPDDDNDGIPDEEEITNGTDPKTPTTQTPTIEITQQPNGNAIVTPKKPDGSTYPPGTKVEIPGENGTTITVTIGDNGSGEVPNDNLPKQNVPGTGTVTEPNKSPSKPVDVTTPARKTPTLDVEQDPKTGDVTVTPKRPGGGTYPPGTKVEIPGKDGNPITVTIGEDGKGKVPNSELPDGKVPGTGKITEPGKSTEEVPNVTTPSKIIPGAPTTEQPGKIEITQKPNGDAIVTPKKPDDSTYPPGTKVEIPGEDKDGNPITITVTIGDNGSGEVPNDNLPKKDIPGTGTVTEPNKNPSKPVDVTTPARKTPTLEVEQDPKTGDVTVTPNRPGGGTYPPGTKVEIPGKDGNPITVTIGEDGKGKVPNSELPEGKVPGTGKITEPGKPTEEVPNVTTPARKTPTLEVEQDPKTGDVTVTPKKPGGGTYPPGTKVEIPGKDGNPITVTIGEDGKGKVPNSELPEGKVPGTGKITEPGKSTEEVPNVTTPARKTPTLEVEQDPKTGDVTVTPKRPGGGTYPPGTKVEIPGKDGNPITVTIGEDGKGKVPNSELPEGKVPGTGKITEPGKPTEEVPNVTTPARKTPTLEVEQDPKTGDVTVTPKKPDGSTYPPGTKVEIPGKDGNPITVTIGEDGKGTVPNSELPEGKVPGTGKITEPGKPAVEVPNVETPSKIIPGAPTTEQPGKIEITQKPNGDAIVTPKKPDGSTYPPGTKVEIPGENGTTITVTIGDNGSGEVPNDNLPKGDLPGTGTVTEPNKNPSKPVDVTTPARKTPTLEVEQDPKTGDVTVTPKRPGGGTYPPGTKVEIPGKDGNPITVTIGEDGKGKVPNSELPEGKVPGTGKITEPGKPAVEVPNVETPSKIIPGAPTTEQPVDIEITRKPNGDAVVTPKKPDGKPYPPGTKVEIPGEDKDGNPITITVTIGDNGSGEVPNDNLPKKDIPGTGTVTEPNKNPSKPVDVTTPARKTPTLEVEQDPKTGDVTVTPKRPGGGTYPPGTKVEIPGKDGNSIIVTIGEDGKGKVPNSELPEGKVPGTGKITEPGKPTEEVPNVTTPARKTPTLEVEQDPKTGDVTVTPKKPDGSTYPPGTKVEIPGKDGNPITVTIGEDGKGTVPNSELPEGKVPGTGKITEPGKPAVEVPNVTTPAKFTPETPVTEKPGKIEITQQPSGNAIVTPKKPDGSTYPPGTKVEIPGENGTTITVTIGDNGSGEVPNDKLPKGNVPGTGRVTEPNKKPSQPVDVTTPARKTPTVELEQDPKTGDVTVTPKKPDGSTYPPGTKVEIPGKDGNSIIVTIGEDGKGKVPNSELPEGKVPGTAKITEPGQPTVEVPDVTTPGKVTPSTDTNPVAPVTPDMPVKPDTNGDSGQDKPAPATPTPNAVAPNADQVDAKTTVDNGAKSNDSQNVLPNTGTESNATLASLGLLGLLSGFGLVARKKKED